MPFKVNLFKILRRCVAKINLFKVNSMHKSSLIAFIAIQKMLLLNSKKDYHLNFIGETNHVILEDIASKFEKKKKKQLSVSFHLCHP